jgi:hypothetical protein
MFETSRRPHPLHTFRFWFVIVAAGAVTLAWKLDLLPFRVGPAETGRLAPEAFTDVDAAGKSVPADSHEQASPFYEADPKLNFPTIAPQSRSADATTEDFDLADISAPADALSQSARPPSGTIDRLNFPAQSEPPADRSATTTQSAAAANPFRFDADEWPTRTASTSTAARQTDARASNSSGESSRRSPSGSPLLQTSATTSAFEAPQTPAAEATDARLSQDAATAERSPGIDFTRIDKLLASGLPADEIDAHRELSTLYWKQPELRAALRERIDTLAQKIYFLNSRHYMDAYEVQPGDTLQAIARQYDVSWQYLARLNRVDPRRVRAGQRLKVIKGPFSAIVDLSDFELTVHAHGYFVTRYPVGIGKDGSSPIGKFAVLEKLVDPTYYGPDGVVAHDDPANPLGERWIDIGNSYGIHGTIDPASIGKSESQGCIRLHNDDVEAVYDLLSIGSEVVIRP